MSNSTAMSDSTPTLEQRASQLDDLPLASNAKVRAELWKLIQQHKWSFVGVCCSYLAMGAFTASLPRLVGLMTDRAGAGVPFAQYQHLLLWALAAAAASGLAAAAARVFSGWLGAAIAADARCRFVHHANNIPLGLIERLGAGQLIARVTDDVNRVAATCKWSILMLANAGVLLLATTAQVVFGTGWLGLSAIPMLIVWVYASRYYLSRSTRAYQRIARSDARVAAVVTETTRAAESVDAHGLAKLRVQLLGDALRSMWVAQRFAVTLRANYVPYLTGSVLLTGALVAVSAAWLIPLGHASFNQATTALASVALMFPFARMFGMVVDEVQLGQVSYARLLGLEDLRKPVAATDHDTPPAGVITLTDVNFGYHPEVQVLHNVSLTIHPGESVALVGPSGCGKSTVARLIAGLSTATSGTVSLGKIDVSTIPGDTLRRGVMLLTQEQHVFAATVADNLRLAAPEASLSEVQSALEAVGGQSWLTSLPEGIETVIGDGGVRVGPAQAQQLALARVLLADPHTIILDEATSLLDPASAEDVEKSFMAFLKNRTVIAIAHQLHTAVNADKVVMMSAGRVAEVGTHTELLAAGQGYARLFEAWSSSKSGA